MNKIAATNLRMIMCANNQRMVESTSNKRSRTEALAEVVVPAPVEEPVIEAPVVASDEPPTDPMEILRAALNTAYESPHQ